jgi:hypothetical protein
MRSSRPSSNYSSPRKSKAVKITQQVTVSEIQIHEELHNVTMKLSEQEIESERLKTTIIALNAKAVIVDDHKNDADNHYSNH